MLRFYETERIVSFVPSFKGIPNNSIYAFLSLCTIIFSLFPFII